MILLTQEILLESGEIFPRSFKDSKDRWLSESTLRATLHLQEHIN